MRKPERINVIGSQISACGMENAMDSVDSALRQRVGGYVCFTNVHATVMGRQDPEFNAITNHSLLSVADGKPVYWVGALKGNREIAHTPGPDFFLHAVRRFPERGHFFYGSTPKVLGQLTEHLRALVPGIKICGSFSPPFRPLTAEDKQQHYAMILESGAEFVWVGMGAPKQEKWMAESWQHLQPCILFGVGAAFDFYAGTVRRAPPILGRLGLEWAYRLSQEPGRLWKRYLVTNSLFLAYVLKDLVFTGSRIRGR